MAQQWFEKLPMNDYIKNSMLSYANTHSLNLERMSGEDIKALYLKFEAQQFEAKKNGINFIPQI